MATPQIVTGDDVSLSITLKKNNAVFTIADTAAVKVRVVASNHLCALSPQVTQVHTTAGADWANALLIVLIPSAVSALITQQGPAALEIEVDDGGKLTWFADVQVVKGLIS